MRLKTGADNLHFARISSQHFVYALAIMEAVPQRWSPDRLLSQSSARFDNVDLQLARLNQRFDDFGERMARMERNVDNIRNIWVLVLVTLLITTLGAQLG